MRMLRMISIFVTMFLLVPAPLRAKEFEIFDGRFYNGKYYPRLDIIEWSDNPGDPSRMEFHVYGKQRTIQSMSFKLGEKNGRKVMFVKYKLNNPSESLCRHVLAPGHFDENFLIYTDHSDVDFVNTIVTMMPMPEHAKRTPASAEAYSPCEEEAEDAPKKPSPAVEGLKPSSVAEPPKKKALGGAIKKEGASVPFGDL